MKGFTEEQMEEAVLSYFGDEEASSCPSCGRPLEFASEVVPAFGLSLRVRCPACQLSGEWQQPQPSRDWKELHLAYFQEAWAEDRPMRCPIDDSFVTSVEFESKVVQIVCPFCNRRGVLGRSPPE